jgi:hypothetical protein
MASDCNISQEGSSPCKNVQIYQSVVSVVIYATLTRPDIVFDVNKVSQYMHKPTEAHWNAVKRILRYVAGTLHNGLHFYKHSPLYINFYSDAD